MAKSCPHCKITETKTSKAEQELYAYVVALSKCKYEVLHNCRKLLPGKEVDIYIPSKKLAVEFDGLYWHNDDNQQNYKYHLEKTEECERKGV